MCQEINVLIAPKILLDRKKYFPSIIKTFKKYICFDVCDRTYFLQEYFMVLFLRYSDHNLPPNYYKYPDFLEKTNKYPLKISENFVKYF